MKNSLVIAANAKGISNLYKRASVIGHRYGFTPNQMDQALQRFSEILKKYGYGATFPITAVTLQRQKKTIQKYSDQNLEFAVHGYTHIDYSHLPYETQINHIKQALEIFSRAGINPCGFRSPYLSRNTDLYTALASFGLKYVSNQPIFWDVLDYHKLNKSNIASYERAFAFYDPWQANEQISLPRKLDSLVEIPVSLPDDEMIVDRVGETNILVKEIWLEILSRTYANGELFTLQLHPERTFFCADGLTAVLEKILLLSPKVWCARLDEIAKWWSMRKETSIKVIKTSRDEYGCDVTGPPGTTVLIRNIETTASCQAWADQYFEVKASHFNLFCSNRPFIGISPSTSSELTKFLREQGYIVEVSLEPYLYSHYIDQENFRNSQERSIVADIEGSSSPLIRFGRWPNGAKSALAISGDIDSMTIWDYGLRLIGK